MGSVSLASESAWCLPLLNTPTINRLKL